jgi:hypothetical protein
LVARFVHDTGVVVAIDAWLVGLVQLRWLRLVGWLPITVSVEQANQRQRWR